jgi:hypothetical protein
MSEKYDSIQLPNVPQHFVRNICPCKVAALALTGFAYVISPAKWDNSETIQIHPTVHL